MPDHFIPPAFTRAHNDAQPVSADVPPFGGVFLKRHTLPRAGAFVGQHAHAYDHTTLIAAGGLRAWCDGDLLGDFHAPAELPIPAGKKHTFEALADATVLYCIHAAATYAETERAALPGIPSDCASCKGCVADDGSRPPLLLDGAA